MIIVNPLLFRLMPNPPRGMALFPFILIRHEYDVTNEELINHEKIHIRQELELLILPFYFFYIVNYLVNLIKYQNHHQAYCNICFEREAYFHDEDLNYLKTRKLWSFLRFL